MSRYFERNRLIGFGQETVIRFLMKEHKKEELIEDIENCGIPVVGEILRVVREDVDKILWYRTFELLDYVTVTVIWKLVMGSSFRPLFFRILHHLLTTIDPEDLVPYMHDPEVWSVNRYARRKKRVRGVKRL